MGNLDSDFYFNTSTGLALRQKYVNFESFVNQLFMEKSINKTTRNVLLFDKNIAIGMLKIKNNKKIIEPIMYVYSSSQINSRNTETVFGGKIKDTRKNMLKVIDYLDSEFVLRPEMYHFDFMPLKVNSQNEIGEHGAFFRKHDTEYKILEHFSKVIKSVFFEELFIYMAAPTSLPEIYVDIYTRLEPCKSCINVADQFVNKYPTSNVKFYYDVTYR